MDINEHIERETPIGRIYHRDQKLRIKSNLHGKHYSKHAFPIGTIVYIKEAIIGGEGFFMASDKPDSDPTGQVLYIINIKDTKPYLFKESTVIVTTPDSLNTYATSKGLHHHPSIASNINPKIDVSDIWHDFESEPPRVYNNIELGEMFCSDFIKQQNRARS